MSLHKNITVKLNWCACTYSSFVFSHANDLRPFDFSSPFLTQPHRVVCLLEASASRTTWNISCHSTCTAENSPLGPPALVAGTPVQLLVCVLRFRRESGITVAFRLFRSARLVYTERPATLNVYSCDSPMRLRFALAVDGPGPFHESVPGHVRHPRFANAW